MDFKYKHGLGCTTDYYTTSYNFIEIIILVALSFGLRYIFFQDLGIELKQIRLA
jgi:hypothetical protein